MVWSCWWCWEGEELDFKGRGRERVKRLWWWWEREERDEGIWWRARRRIDG